MVLDDIVQNGTVALSHRSTMPQQDLLSSASPLGSLRWA
jgi:hypothetical protein